MNQLTTKDTKGHKSIIHAFAYSRVSLPITDYHSLITGSPASAYSGASPLITDYRSLITSPAPAYSRVSPLITDYRLLITIL